MQGRQTGRSVVYAIVMPGMELAMTDWLVGG